MPTKPVDLPPVWAGAGNYPAGVYSTLLPWLAPNPLAGQPFPWGGQPRLNAGSLTAFANTGFTPQVPNNPSQYNEWLRRVQIYVNWVDLGTSADDADAHVMETDASGISSAQKYQATAGFCNAGVTSAVMLAGATIPNGEKLTLTGTAEVAGGAGSAVTAEAIAGAVFEVTAPGLAPTLRQFGAGTNDVFVYNDGALKAFHYSLSGYVYATGDQEAATGLAVTTLVPVTTVRVLPTVAINVRVIAEGWGQRNSAGTVDIRLQASDGALAYSNIGVVQTSTWVDQSDVNGWSYFRIERVFAAGILLARFYRVSVAGNGGSTAKVRETSIRVVNERA